MAADLEALFAHYLSRGLPEEEAARRAEERILASPAEVQRLVELHSSGEQRWLGWLAGRLRRELDLFLFAVGVLPVLALGVGILVPRIGAAGGDPFLWVLLAIGAAIAGLSLFLRSDAGFEELRRGLSGVLFLGAMGLAVAALGFLTHLCSLSLRLSRGVPEGADWGGAAEEIGRAATLLGTGILLAMAAGVLWFLLANRLAALERVERELLLGE